MNSLTIKDFVRTHLLSQLSREEETFEDLHLSISGQLETLMPLEDDQEIMGLVEDEILECVDQGIVRWTSDEEISLELNLFRSPRLKNYSFSF